MNARIQLISVKVATHILIIWMLFEPLDQVFLSSQLRIVVRGCEYGEEHQESLS